MNIRANYQKKKQTNLTIQIQGQNQYSTVLLTVNLASSYIIIIIIIICQLTIFSLIIFVNLFDNLF